MVLNVNGYTEQLQSFVDFATNTLHLRTISISKFIFSDFSPLCFRRHLLFLSLIALGDDFPGECLVFSVQMNT